MDDEEAMLLVIKVACTESLIAVSEKIQLAVTVAIAASGVDRDQDFGSDFWTNNKMHLYFLTW